MEDEIKYMRIGTSLYKVVRKPGLSGSIGFGTDNE